MRGVSISFRTEQRSRQLEMRREAPAFGAISEAPEAMPEIPLLFGLPTRSSQAQLMKSCVYLLAKRPKGLTLPERTLSTYEFLLYSRGSRGAYLR
jgi:hypothetical protein